MVNQAKVQKRIELAMANNKADSEKKVTGQSYDLLLHGLKFLIHVDSYNGSYSYWQKDIASTLHQIADAATKVKKQGELKKRWVVAELVTPWEGEASLKRNVLSIYKDDSIDMAKRYPNYKDFVSTFDATKLDGVFTNLVDALYDTDNEKTWVEIAHDFFNDLKQVSPLNKLGETQ